MTEKSPADFQQRFSFKFYEIESFHQVAKQDIWEELFNAKEQFSSDHLRPSS